MPGLEGRVLAAPSCAAPFWAAFWWLREVTANLPDRSRRREVAIVRIKGAFQRAEELSDDVAARIERVL
jgi:hypothetical protein